MDEKPPSPIAPTVVAPGPASAAAPAPAVDLGSRYEILRELGSGGMGRVFQARDRETNEMLALKVLRAEIAAEPSMEERFKNELRLARRITHKNVCRIYDFNRRGPLAYISMEYVDGETLRARLHRSGAMPASRVAWLARQVCAGLAEAHAQGIVHRDLKPENIMITAAGPVKLMDFGIARSIHANAGATQTLIGTPSYMAPEQVRGRGVDARADIYALGLILYECLTGRRAFAGVTPVEVAMKQLQERPAVPHTLRADVPRAVEAVVMRCLEKEPARRFASVEEVARALAAVGSRTATPPAARPRGRWMLVAVAAAFAAVMWARRHEGVQAPTPVAPPRAAPVASARPAETPTPRVVPMQPVQPADTPRAAPQQASSRRIDKPEPAKTAFDQLQSSAAAGDAEAQLRLARMLSNGPPEVRDETAARTWMQRAAEQGNVEAQFALGLMYERGRGGPRDPGAAESWFRRAAAAGNEGARMALARLSRRPRRRLRRR